MNTPVQNMSLPIVRTKAVDHWVALAGGWRNRGIPRKILRFLKQKDFIGNLSQGWVNEPFDGRLKEKNYDNNRCSTEAYASEGTSAAYPETIERSNVIWYLPEKEVIVESEETYTEPVYGWKETMMAEGALRL